MTRGEQIGSDVITAPYTDRLRRCDSGWKLARRDVVIDQAILGTHNLNTIDPDNAIRLWEVSADIVAAFPKLAKSEATVNSTEAS